MKFTRTEIPEVVVIEPIIHEDDRGYFIESFRKDKLTEFLGYTIPFIQDNESMSKYGVVRGLHYQLPIHCQTKLVRVVHGKILDVAVDIRKGSPTFGKHVSVELSSKNKKQLLVPRGFAHGFSVLSKEAIVAYKVDDIYSAKHNVGIAFNDKELNIDWKLPKDKMILSDADLNQPPFNEAKLIDYNLKLYE